MQRKKLPVTSVRLLGVKVPVRQLKNEKNDSGEVLAGSYHNKIIRLTTEGYEAHDMIRTLVHEAIHAYLNLSGLDEAVCGDDYSKEELLVQGLENHIYPLCRALARMEAGLPQDAEDRKVLSLSRKKEGAI